MAPLKTHGGGCSDGAVVGHVLSWASSASHSGVEREAVTVAIEAAHDRCSGRCPAAGAGSAVQAEQRALATLERAVRAERRTGVPRSEVTKAARISARRVTHHPRIAPQRRQSGC